jgi:hypothetical protein
MKKILIILSLTMVLIPLYSISCAGKTSINESIVQVWQPAITEGENATLLSFGVAVGDGSQILTVLNYEDYTPDGLEVGFPGKTKYPASVEAIDPRTSATLLKVIGTKFKAATIGEPDKLEQGHEITIHGWPGPEFDSLESVTVSFAGYDTIMSIDVMNNDYICYDGAPVTDKDDRVIGLIGTFYNAFVFRLGEPGMTAPIININKALELLSLDTVSQPWAGGPAFAIKITKESLTGYAIAEPPLANYNAMTAAIESLLRTMGDPLPTNELPGDYRSFNWGGPESVDGTLLSLAYPRPVELRNTENQLVAEAKWLGIQWGRSEGKSNRIFYGHFEQGNAVVDGGYILKGDINAVESVLS